MEASDENAATEPRDESGVPEAEAFRERLLDKEAPEDGQDSRVDSEGDSAEADVRQETEQKITNASEMTSIEPLSTADEPLPEKEPTADVGSFSRNDNQIVVTEQEPGNEGLGRTASVATVETSDLHPSSAEPEARAEPEAQERTLEAVDYGKGAVVRVPKTDLEREGYEPEPGENAIVQLGMRNVESEDVETVFARYNASDRRAEAYVGDISGEKGSRYELVEAREYNEERMVRDFERGKCDHLQNVRLEHDEGKMFLNVDDRRVELENCRLSTSGSHVILRGKQEENSCKIEYDGRKASVRFGRDYLVEGMEVKDDVLTVRYAQSRNEKHEKRIHLEHLDAPERPSLGQFDKEEMKEHVKMFDHPEKVEGLYQFVLDASARQEIVRLLEEAAERGKNEYALMKAEISERLVPNLMELVGWERIRRHPYNESDKDGASANDVDWLLRAPDRKPAITEIKWWADPSRAESRGMVQLSEDYEANRACQGEKVGAYLMIMDWKGDETPIRVYVKKLEPRENLI